METKETKTEVTTAISFRQKCDICLDVWIKASWFASTLSIILVVFLGLPNFIRDADVAILASNVQEIAGQVAQARDLAESLDTSRILMSQKINKIQEQAKIKVAMR